MELEISAVCSLFLLLLQSATTASTAAGPYKPPSLLHDEPQPSPQSYPEHPTRLSLAPALVTSTSPTASASSPSMEPPQQQPQLQPPAPVAWRGPPP